MSFSNDSKVQVPPASQSLEMADEKGTSNASREIAISVAEEKGILRKIDWQ